VAEIDFADGFDVPEPLAWGLTPAQLGAILAGAVLAYLALHSPIPRVAAIPLAVMSVGGGLALALVRREGRTLISWATVAVRFWARPRSGLLLLVNEEPAAPRPGSAGWDGGRHDVETARRAPLVLLPEPVEQPPSWAGTTGIRPHPFSIFSVADAAVLETSSADADPPAPTALRIPTGGGAGMPGIGVPAALRATRRLTFFSLSGGSGRTTLAVEVAGLLAGQAHSTSGWGLLAAPRVALVDLDLMSPRAGIRLGVPAATDWDVVEAGSAAPAVESLLAVHRSGLRVLPGPARPLAPGAGDRPELVRGLAAAVAELESRGCDTIVLDVPGDLSALTRWALESAHDVFVVLTPTAGGVQDAYRSTEVLRRLGLRHRLRYVVNRGHGGPPLAEAMLDLGGVILAEIPDDPDLERAEMDHRLLGVEGTGRTATALRALAATVDTRLLAPGAGVEPPGAHRWLRRRAG
jgi:MinD-like ATPase involved in chromosome partitioning or flagellar assembly